MMKLTDKELEEVVFAELRRCEHSESDNLVAEKITTAIIRAEQIHA